MAVHAQRRALLITGYLDEYEKARGKLPGYLAWKAEWIRTLYRNLKHDDSGQVCSFLFYSARKV